MSVLRGERRPGGSRLIGWAVGVTALLHGGLFAAILIGRALAGAAPPPAGMVMRVVEVQAVKFGKPRDMSFLPHKTAPAVTAKPKLALTDNANALPKLKDPSQPERTEDDPLRKTRTDLFKDLQGEEDSTGAVEDVGDPNGIRGGSATEGKGPVYYQHLQAAVQNNWNLPPSLRDDELARLAAVVCIKIDVEGKIFEVKMMTASGDERYDSTLLTAVQKIEKLEPPTPDVKDDVTTEGVCMNFRYMKTRP